MDNSLNSDSESTFSHNPKKAAFNKPNDFYQAFEVSMEESVRASLSNKSDLVLDVTSSGADKVLPFRKSRKSIQHSFNVSSGESLVNNESGQSVTFTKPQGLFAKQNKSLVDFFNVSFNETKSQDAFGKSIDIDQSQVTEKINPFKKKNESQNEVTIGAESSALHSGEDGNDVMVAAKESQKPSSTCHDSIDGDEADSTTFMTKPNPFKRSSRPENDSLTQLRLSVTEESRIDENSDYKNQTANNLEIYDSIELSTSKTKSNPFKQKDCSVTKETHNKCSLIEEPEECSVMDESNSEYSLMKEYENECSVMKESENECSLTKERQAILNSQVAEANPLSLWEQKFNEMVTNAEKKSKALKFKTLSDSPKKANTLKKSKVSTEKSVCPDENAEVKYKPPKLLKPASFVSKQLYGFIKKKLELKYGIDAVLESENLVALICETVKKVTRRKNYQKGLIQKLKKEMAEAGLIETTVDFYEFVIKFLPYSFRVKVVPCLQPITNMVYPPKDITNPFDKVL